MNNYRNMMKQGYQEDLQDCVARAAKGQCPPWQQDYCFGEIAQAKGTDAYPEEGDTLLAELRRLVDTVPQCTNREADAAEMAALGGKQLFYLAAATRWWSWCSCRTAALTAGRIRRPGTPCTPAPPCRHGRRKIPTPPAGPGTCWNSCTGKWHKNIT